MDDAARVAAILGRDPQGLANTYDAYGSALYAFCHSMLRDRHEAEDAVQDTFIVLAERVGQLRDPNRLRPWLYAVARSQCLRRLRASKRLAPVEQVGDMMDESADLAEGLRTRELQQLVWQAMAGLNAGERSALELSLRHGLDGDDLAAALGVSRANAAKLMQRARSELDRSLGALLVARADDGSCPVLGRILVGWDAELTPLMRKRLGRHIDSCAQCGAQKQRRVNASALLAAIPLLAAPVALRDAILGHDRTAMVSYDRAIARRAGVFDRVGFPDERGARRRARSAAIAGALCLVLAGIAVVVPSRTHHASLHLPALPLSTSMTTNTVSPPSASSSVPASPSSSQATHSATRTPLTSSPSVIAPPPTSTTHVRSSGPPPTSKTTSSSPPPKVTLTVSPTSMKFPFAAGGTEPLDLTATGGTITWSATDKSGLLKLSAFSGTIKGGGKATISVTASPEKKLTSDTITVSWASGSTSVAVVWS